VGSGGEAGAGGEAGQGGEAGEAGQGGEAGEGGSAGQGGAGGFGCEEPLTYYKDFDRDGHGDFTKPEKACEPPPDTKDYGWSLKGDDCNDGNPEVFPGQTKFFPEPYPTGPDKVSFDYNCSGKEEGTNTAPLQPKCSDYFTPGSCNGKKGYKPTNTKTSNAYCGSATLVVCVFDNLKCNTTNVAASEPYRCN
jgi:hypothetical protein